MKRQFDAIEMPKDDETTYSNIIFLIGNISALLCTIIRIVPDRVYFDLAEQIYAIVPERELKGHLK